MRHHYPYLMLYNLYLLPSFTCYVWHVVCFAIIACILFIGVFCSSSSSVCPCNSLCMSLIVSPPCRHNGRVRIMNTSEHNKLMVTICYCLGIAVWHQCREDYIVIVMTHFRTITTRYSSVIFVPAYYHLGTANAALHQ